jgi:PKD repeat protein
LAVTADASASHDSDGSITQYSINFGDGTVQSTASATHTYSVAGTFTVTATVTDNGGASSTASKTVTVSAAPPPTCSISTVDRTITICQPRAGSTVTSPVNVVVTVTDKKAVQYVQVYIDGAKKLQQNNTKQINTSIAVAKGSHSLTVQAKDNSGTFSKTVVFTVN